VGEIARVGYCLMHLVQAGAGPEGFENLHGLRCSLAHYFVAPRSDFLASVWHKFLKFT